MNRESNTKESAKASAPSLIIELIAGHPRRTELVTANYRQRSLTRTDDLTNTAGLAKLVCYSRPTIFQRSRCDNGRWIITGPESADTQCAIYKVHRHRKATPNDYALSVPEINQLL